MLDFHDGFHDRITGLAVALFARPCETPMICVSERWDKQHNDNGYIATHDMIFPGSVFLKTTKQMVVN